MFTLGWRVRATLDASATSQLYEQRLPSDPRGVWRHQDMLLDASFWTFCNPLSPTHTLLIIHSHTEINKCFFPVKAPSLLGGLNSIFIARFIMTQIITINIHMLHKGNPTGVQTMRWEGRQYQHMDVRQVT